jgi:hypothetical protein
VAATTASSAARMTTMTATTFIPVVKACCAFTNSSVPWVAGA